MDFHRLFHALTHPHVPEKAAHAAHRLHRHVQRAEGVAHAYYLGLVTVHGDYAHAAGFMLGTVVVGTVLHTVIALGGGQAE